MSDRRTGKIARLPYDFRTIVNTMLRDGEPYANIIQFLHETPGVDVNDQNLTNWSQGGHQDWLKEQARLEEMKAKREFAMEIVKQNDGSKLHEANLHLAASQIYDVLTDFDPERLKALLDEKPENYANIVNALGKLSKSNVELQKYKDAVAEQKKKILAITEAGAKTGGVSEEARQQIREAAALL